VYCSNPRGATAISTSLETFCPLIPPSLLQQSGRVFYSGRAAFSAASSLYILGLNPGGCPKAQEAETIEAHITTVLARDSPHWSAYRDDAWGGRAPGTYTMQPRVLHLLERLEYAPHLVPASNLVFSRSAREADLRDFGPIAELCWPFHGAVIERLGVRVILCFGNRCGKWVRRRLNADRYVDGFIEQNGRQWKSYLHCNSGGLLIITARHPSVADWTTPSADPTPLVELALRRAAGSG
jgi:hypothetical protein